MIEYVNHASLQYDIMCLIFLLPSTQPTLLLSDHYSISSSVVLNDKLCQSAIMISCVECFYYTLHSQPSYCLTIQYRPQWFWMINYASLQYDIMWFIHSSQSTLLLSYHSLSITLVLNDNNFMPVCNMMFFDECIYTVDIQPSYYLTIHYVQFNGFKYLDTNLNVYKLASIVVGKVVIHCSCCS